MKQTNIRRTEITIETHSLLIVKIKTAENARVYCAGCGQTVQPLTLLQAALIFRAGKEQLAALAGAGQIHMAGRNALCPVALAGHFKQEIRFIED